MRAFAPAGPSAVDAQHGARSEVARATVVEAYEQLLSEGYIEARNGSGTRVAAELPEALLNSSCTAACRPSRTAKKAASPASPFRSGLVDWEHFPHDEWGRLLGRVWRNPPIAMLEHNDAFGWLPLREAIARHLFEWRGISCEAPEVIMTAGGMDAFDLIARAIFRPATGYGWRNRAIRRAGGCSRWAASSPSPCRLTGKASWWRRAARGPATRAAAFVTPFAAISDRRYHAVVAPPRTAGLGGRAPRPQVIEDDYDSEYRYVGRPLPALMSLDRNGRVIYAGSFSKVFSPLLRLGFIVVPKALTESFRAGAAGARRAALAPGAACVATFMDVGHVRHPYPPHAAHLCRAPRGAHRQPRAGTALSARCLAIRAHATAAPGEEGK